MSITRDHDLIVFECDECHQMLESKTNELGVAIATLEELNWESTKDNKKSDWKHLCPECQQTA